MSEAYFQTIVFTKGNELEQRYVKDVGQELPAIDIINRVFNEVASSRMDVTWVCDRYISKEFSFKDDDSYSDDREHIRDSLFILQKMRQSRKVKISSIFNLSSIKDLKDAIKPYYNKNEEIPFGYQEIARTSQYVLYEIFSEDGYRDVTGTAIGYAVIKTPYNKRAFVLEDLKRGKKYGLNCAELKATTINNSHESRSSFKFIIKDVIPPTELEKLVPSAVLDLNNMFYQLLKHRSSRFTFQKDDYIRIEKFLNNIERVYGDINSSTLYSSIMRTDVFLRGYDFFESLLHYMTEHDIDFDWNMLKKMMITMSTKQIQELENKYGNISPTEI